MIAALKHERLWLSGGVGIALFAVVRFFILINTHAVNMLYLDMWGFYTAAFDDYSFWDTYTFQHGPHRQGIGFVIMRMLDQLSGWNTRVICFAIGGFLTIAAGVYLLLFRKLFGNLKFTDFLMVVLVLAPAQYQLFTNTPNISYGAMPALLIALYAWGLTIKNDFFKGSLIVILNFNLIFSAFGLFAGVLTPVLFTAECVRNLKLKKKKKAIFYAVMLAVAISSLAIFFLNYRTTADLSGNEEISMGNILKFVSIAYYNFFSATLEYPFKGLAVVIPVFIVGFWCAYSWAKNLWKTPELRDDIPLITSFLVGFSLIFIVVAAVGRLPIGLDSAYASRYLTYLIPSIIGLYVFARSQNSPIRLILTTGMVVLIMGASLERKRMRYFSDQKKTWKEQYLLQHDVELTNKTTQFSIHPKSETEWFKERMHYLEERKLNLFLDEK